MLMRRIKVMSAKTLEEIVQEKEFYNDIKRNYHLEFQQEEGRFSCMTRLTQLISPSLQKYSG